MIFQKTPLALALAGLVMASAVQAQTTAPNQSAITTLGKVKIVAPPIVASNDVDSFGSLSTVVNAEQIQDLNALDLSSALRRTPGVVVSRFNPVGSFGGGEGGAVYIRGQGASRPGSEIKTYIDGVPFYMGVWDHPLLDLLPVHAVGSVQVHKAPQPQRFGNTFAAIELLPMQAPPEGQVNGLQLTGGSYATFTENALLSGRNGALDYVVAQGYARSDGARDDGDGRLLNGFARFSYRINDAWATSLMVLAADNKVSDPGENGLPETKGGRFNTQGQLIAAKLSHTHGVASGSLMLYSNTGRGSALEQPGLDGDTISDFDLKGLRWDERLALGGAGEVAAGLDVDEIDGTVSFRRVAPAEQAHYRGPTLRIVSPRIAFSYALDLPGAWTLTPSLGIRAYDHNIFDSTNAPHAGLVLKGDGQTYRLNASRGVNYPGQGVVVLSLLIPVLGETWRNLAPETVEHVELGAAFELARSTHVDMAVFQDDYKDRYAFAFPPTVLRPSFTNIGSYRMRGAEATLTQGLGQSAEAFLGFTWLDPSLANVPYAPKRAVSFGLNARHQQWKASVDAQYQSAMFVLAKARSGEAGAFSQVGAFTVVNLRLAREVPALGRNGEVFAAVENILDREYAFRTGYPMPGRNAQLGLRIGF